MDDGGGSRYELLELIGAGGMAEVFRARMVGAVGFEKLVAIKRILPDFTSDHEFVQRFIDEARLTARLVHPNICQILDFGTMEDRYFIAMEYVEGLDLMAVLNGVDREKEKIPVDVVLFVICSTLRGLKYAHEATDEGGSPLSIVHRDVSPSNVLLSVNGDVKLSDLGAATAAPEVRSARTERHFRLGKVLYMAPEQRRMHAVDARADIYSTGILLAEMLLGESRFHKNANMFLAGLCTLWDQVDDEMSTPVGAALASVIETALAEDPNNRFQSADEMLTVVDRLMVEYAPGTSVDRVSRLVKRIKRRFELARENSRMLEEPEVSAVISLHTGDIQAITGNSQQSTPSPTSPEFDLEAQILLPTDLGLGQQELEEEPTMARGSQHPAAYGQADRFSTDELDESPTIARLPRITPEDVAGHDDLRAGINEYAPTMAANPAYEGPEESPGIPDDYAEQGYHEEDEPVEAPAQPSRESGWAPDHNADQRGGTVAEPPPREEPEPTEAEQKRGPARWLPGLVIALVVTAVLVIGVAFGGILADRYLTVPTPVDHSELVGTTNGNDTTPAPPDPPPLPPPATFNPSVEGGGGEGSEEAGPRPEEVVEPPDSHVEEPSNQGTEEVEEPSNDAALRPPPPHPVQPRRNPPQEPSTERPRNPDNRRSTRYGQLNIMSRPFGIPYVDGRQIAPETPVAGHRLTTGRHRVSVYFPQQGRRVNRTVMIEANETTGVNINLSEE